jgi:hypothetical protein
VRSMSVKSHGSMLHAIAPMAVAAEEMKTNQQIVFGGSRVTGVLVVPDGTEPPVGVPTISYSKFSKVIEQSNVQIYQPLITPVHPTLPFAFVVAPRRETGTVSSYQLIAPPEILLEKDVHSWKLTTVNWNIKPGYGAYWLLVLKAERLG